MDRQYYQAECFIYAVYHAFPVLSMLYRITETLLLLLQILRIHVLCISPEVLRRRYSIVYPGWSSNKVSNGGPGQFGHLGNNLNAR